jgi:hypothetical protein
MNALRLAGKIQIGRTYDNALMCCHLFMQANKILSINRQYRSFVSSRHSQYIGIGKFQIGFACFLDSEYIMAQSPEFSNDREGGNSRWYIGEPFLISLVLRNL